MLLKWVSERLALLVVLDVVERVVGVCAGFIIDVIC